MPKKIIEVTKKLVYQCNVCKKTNWNKCLVDDCEKSHQCKHKDFKHNISGKVYEDIIRTVFITRVCKNCNQELGQMQFDDGCYHQEFLCNAFNEFERLGRVYNERENNTY